LEDAAFKNKLVHAEQAEEFVDQANELIGWVQFLAENNQ
jgi:hypothetical protein